MSQPKEIYINPKDNKPVVVVPVDFCKKVDDFLCEINSNSSEFGNTAMLVSMRLNELIHSQNNSNHHSDEFMKNIEPNLSRPRRPKYRISKNIESSEGTQEFEVEAKNEEEAIQKFKDGGGELVETEYEVTDLSEFDWDTLYKLDPPKKSRIINEFCL